MAGHLHEKDEKNKSKRNKFDYPTPRRNYVFNTLSWIYEQWYDFFSFNGFKKLDLFTSVYFGTFQFEIISEYFS